MQEEENAIVNLMREQLNGVDEGLVDPESAIRSVANMTETYVIKKGEKTLKIKSIDEDGVIHYVIHQKVPGGGSTEYGSVSFGEEIPV